jgi:hypothetical protein
MTAEHVEALNQQILALRDALAHEH